jgi:NhaA family Na+:H+ antiporter
MYTNKSKSPLHLLEAHLHPWVAYVVMPLFALANAGFSLKGMNANFLLDSVVLGIVLGLFVGKQIGVFGFTWFFVKLKWMKLPDNASWLAMYGVSLLCGIGFTMSLFLGTLAFDQELYLSEVRMGVMLGSILSGLAGAAILRAALKK